MRGPLDWGLVVIAAGATAFTVWAGANFALAIPGAAVAVTAAGLLFAEVALRPSAARAAPPAWTRRGEPELLRSAFVSGRLGREKLVEVLDQLERAGPHPDLPSRRFEQLREIVSLPPDEFRRYLRSRIDSLEERT